MYTSVIGMYSDYYYAFWWSVVIIVYYVIDAFIWDSMKIITVTLVVIQRSYGYITANIHK